MSALRFELLDILLKAASDCVGSLKVAVFGCQHAHAVLAVHITHSRHEGA